MKYGLHLPNFGGFGDALLLGDLAYKAEQAGWDGFFLWDHLLFCELDKFPHVDPWVALTVAAMRTSRIKLGTLVTPVPRRRPWKLVRETTTIHNLSGGRLILGVGLGDPVEWEYRFFHDEADAKIRGEKLDEGLTIIKGLWSGETFGFEGKHYHLEPSTFLPVPVTPIPVWVGGNWPHKRPFQRAARHEGMFPNLVEGEMTPDLLKQMIAYVNQYREDASAPFEVLVGGATGEDASGADARKDREMLRRYEDAGATWWIENICPLRFEHIGWEDFWKPWDVPALIHRIEAGPPDTD